jgi:hypothetical protein
MKTPEKTLESYMTAYPAHHTFREVWPVQGEMSVTIGLADTLPPPPVSSSILTIVLDTMYKVLFL